MTTQPSLRIGDAEREAVAAELQEHFARGRLTMEELSARLDATFAAKTQGDLDAITSDLPHARTYGGVLPSQTTSSRAAQRGYTGSWGGSSGRRGHGPGRLSGLASLATLLAMVASILIVFDALAVFRLPLPGKFGLLVAIFTIIRGLIRRIFGGARRGRAGRPW
jgi:Domain of unknown function (DUF1707)